MRGSAFGSFTRERYSSRVIPRYSRIGRLLSLSCHLSAPLVGEVIDFVRECVVRQAHFNEIGHRLHFGIDDQAASPSIDRASVPVVNPGILFVAWGTVNWRLHWRLRWWLDVAAILGFAHAVNAAVNAGGGTCTTSPWRRGRCSSCSPWRSSRPHRHDQRAGALPGKAPSGAGVPGSAGEPPASGPKAHPCVEAGEPPAVPGKAPSGAGVPGSACVSPASGPQAHRWVQAGKLPAVPGKASSGGVPGIAGVPPASGPQAHR